MIIYRISRVVSILSVVVTLNLDAANAQQSPLTVKSLSEKQESIVPIAGFTAKGDQTGLKSALSQGLDAGLSINEINEILIQLYAYTGFPRRLNAVSTFQSVLNERKLKRIRDVVGKGPEKQVFKKMENLLLAKTYKPG